MKRATMSALAVAISTFAVSPESTAQDLPAPASAVLPSPMMAFDQEGAPLRVLYDATFAVSDDPQAVDVRLVLGDVAGQAVRRYVVTCTEEIPSRATVTQVRDAAATAAEAVVFRVRRGAELTFALAAIEYENGSTWTRPAQ